jgi:predicted RNase H-like HicB family nuclease
MSYGILFKLGNTMESLKEIHTIALPELKKKFVLGSVLLKYPFPERPLRTMGLVKADGNVFSSKEFSRVLFLKIDFPVYLAVRSVFLRPRIELDLPAFDCEIVIMGKKRIFLVDINKTQINSVYDNSALFDKLVKIKERYPALLEKTKKPRPAMESVLSRAACLVNITKDDEEQAVSIFREYLAVFSEMVQKATPLSKDALDQAKQAFEGYLETLIDHDPEIQAYKMLFGKEGGESRALNLFFDR